MPGNAGIAQLVERNLAKVEVASSSLVSRSIIFIIESFSYTRFCDGQIRELLRYVMANSGLT
jgi:hypothetical protein